VKCVDERWRFDKQNLEVRDYILKETTDALINHFSLVCGSIAFPELILPT